MQSKNQRASFRVNAHLKKRKGEEKEKSRFSLFHPPSPPNPSCLSLLALANLSEPHPLIRAHLRIGHCASGWLGLAWWITASTQETWLYKHTADSVVRVVNSMLCVALHWEQCPRVRLYRFFFLFVCFSLYYLIRLYSPASCVKLFVIFKQQMDWIDYNYTHSEEHVLRRSECD